MEDGSGGQDALGYGQALVLIGVQQVVRGSIEPCRQLPAKVIGILHPCVQALSTGSRVNVCGITREEDSAHAIAINHADIRAPDREPARIAQTHARYARALVEEALEGLKRRGRQRSLLVWGNGSAEEPGIAVAHPLESQASVQVAPGMCEVGVTPAYADVAQKEMLLVPGLTQERDAGGLAHCAMASIAANQVASQDLLVLARVRDLRDNTLHILGEAHQLRTQFHLPAIRRQSCTQHSLSMFLANHQDGMIGRRHWREERGRGEIAYEVVMVLGGCRRQNFIKRQKGIKHTPLLKAPLRAQAECP